MPYLNRRGDGKTPAETVKMGQLRNFTAALLRGKSPRWEDPVSASIG
jgi:hypothetical protein